jgi:hypothetical protein
MSTRSSRWQLIAGVAVAAVVAAVLTGAGGPPPVAGPVSIDELWQDPGDIAARDLRWGAGGQAGVPSSSADYQFKAIDSTGYSTGYDVVDPQGREWDVKIGDEAQTEVVASRLLWAVGFHQPVVHYLPDWKLTNGPVPVPQAGRFRLGSDHDSVGDWSWTENPFKGSRELKGLVVANLLINNWDLKPSNNKILTVAAPGGPRRWFVVQDVGASFGKTGWPVGNRNSVEDYESQGFIVGVENGRVQFDYQARHKDLLEDITPADVVWISRLFARITDDQLAAAFGAAAMPGDVSERYIRKLKSKIQEGLSLKAITVTRK